MKKVFAAKTLLFAVFALSSIRADAQTVPALENITSQPELDKAITTLDAALFDAYNRCDLEKFSSFFVDNVEFYHDQGGLSIRTKALSRDTFSLRCLKAPRDCQRGGGPKL